MNSIGEKLRAARIQSGLSLDDLAQATKINRQFLEAIEQGTPPKLPQTYYRAFLKTFAQRVGLDAEELLREHAAASPRIEKSDQELTQPLETPTVTIPTARKKNESQPTGHQPSRTLFILLIVLIIGFGVSVIWLRNERNDKPVEEISFANAVKEQEQKILDREHRQDSTTAAADRPLVPPTSKDSLTLEGTTTDSVWMKITIDGVTTHEYTFPSDYTMHWKANKSFLITLGNATGMFFTLNGFPVGTLNAAKKPIKNFTLSWQTVSRLQQQASGGRAQ